MPCTTPNVWLPTLCRGRIVPQEIADKEAAAKFIEAVGQFERIMNDSGFVTLTRLAASEITGQDGKAGIIEKYFSLSQTDTTCLKDIGLYPEEMRVGDDILCLHTLSDVEDLPGKVGTDCRFEKLSTDRSDCRLSFAAPVGVLLSCNHVYNQFIFIDDHSENLKNFEQTARNMQQIFHVRERVQAQYVVPDTHFFRVQPDVDTERDELSFLSRSFERHFNERPFLNHYCYLFLTKTTRERSPALVTVNSSGSSTLKATVMSASFEMMQPFSTAKSGNFLSSVVAFNVFLMFFLPFFFCS